MFILIFFYLQEKEQLTKEKAHAMITREKVKQALDDFAQRQTNIEQTVSS